MKSDEFLPLVRDGAYGPYSGPWTLGKHRFAINADPNFWDKALAATVATEGGRFGPVNMYDRCIISVGLIQLCEAATIYGVTQLLGACADVDQPLLQSYLDEIPGSCLFQKNAKGRWQFFYNGAPVASKAEQRALFLGGSTGYKGQWTKAQKAHAYRVCAVMSCLWQEAKFREAQRKYVGESCLMRFVRTKSRNILFAEGYPREGDEGALRAAFITFAVNNPARADKYFRQAHATEEYKAADAHKRLLIALEAMTFDPGISIYPHRYDAIRPVLEREFSIDLPDFATQLAKFEEDNPNRALFPDVASIQRELIALGYDLGQAGADGIMGSKTKAAIKAVEVKHGLPAPDGIPDSAFIDVLAEEQKKRTKREDPPKPDPEPSKEPEEATEAVDAEPEETIPAAPDSEADEEPLEDPDDRAIDNPQPVEDKLAPETPIPDEGWGGSMLAILVLLLGVVVTAVARAFGWI